jgi:eukaryotic-like serine/threonine-protein kinase
VKKVYSLGVLLYELLTGTTPFDRERFKGAGYDEIRRIIREEEPPRPSTRLSTLGQAATTVSANRKSDPRRLTALVRGELDWVVMKCLEKDRNRRYETANGLARDVERYLADEPVQACPPSAGYRLRKFVRRNKGPVLAASLVLLALVGGIVGTGMGLVQAKLAEAKARTEADQKEAEKKRAVHAEREAKAQAEITREVNWFLHYLLGQADIGNQPLLPGRLNEERNPNVTARELLDRAAHDIEGRFAKQELIEAAIRQTIGHAYRALGEYSQAQEHLERAVELRAAKLGADHPDTLTSKHSLGMLHYEQGKYDRAEALYKEVIDRTTARLGAGHRDALRSKQALAVVCQAKGRSRRAEALFKEVLDGFTATLGAGHHHTLATKSGLAELYLDQGKYDRAERIYKEVLDGFTATLGDDHPHTLASKNGLAWVYHRQEKFELAERLYKEVIAAQTAKRRADHPHTLTSKLNLADMYRDQGKYERAEPLYKERDRRANGQAGARPPPHSRQQAQPGVHVSEPGEV